MKSWNFSMTSMKEKKSKEMSIASGPFSQPIRFAAILLTISSIFLGDIGYYHAHEHNPFVCPAFSSPTRCEPNFSLILRLIFCPCDADDVMSYRIYRREVNCLDDDSNYRTGTQSIDDDGGPGVPSSPWVLVSEVEFKISWRDDDGTIYHHTRHEWIIGQEGRFFNRYESGLMFRKDIWYEYSVTCVDFSGNESQMSNVVTYQGKMFWCWEDGHRIDCQE